MVLSFSVHPVEADLIGEIAERAYQLDRKHSGRHARKLIEWRMDLTAAHASGNPLRLEQLRDADDFNFAHDAFGICRHLNRATGELDNLFRPRFSAPSEAEEAA